MKHWWDNSEAAKDQVTKECTWLKKHQKNKKNKNNDKNNKHHIEEVEVLQDEIKEMKCMISELIIKKKGKDEQGEDDGPPKQDASNAFGGHCEKVKKDSRLPFPVRSILSPIMIIYKRIFQGRPPHISHISHIVSGVQQSQKATQTSRSTMPLCMAGLNWIPMLTQQLLVQTA